MHLRPFLISLGGLSTAEAKDVWHKHTRATRAQVIRWKPDGTPDFGTPRARRCPIYPNCNIPLTHLCH
jgi:GH43 family beta-xylosidase